MVKMSWISINFTPLNHVRANFLPRRTKKWRHEFQISIKCILSIPNGWQSSNLSTNIYLVETWKKSKFGWWVCQITWSLRIASPYCCSTSGPRMTSTLNKPPHPANDFAYLCLCLRVLVDYFNSLSIDIYFFLLNVWFEIPR